MKEKILNWITENIDSYIEVDEESARMGFPYHYYLKFRIRSWEIYR